MPRSPDRRIRRDGRGWVVGDDSDQNSDGESGAVHDPGYGARGRVPLGGLAQQSVATGLDGQRLAIRAWNRHLDGARERETRGKFRSGLILGLAVHKAAQPLAECLRACRHWLLRDQALGAGIVFLGH